MGSLSERQLVEKMPPLLQNQAIIHMVMTELAVKEFGRRGEEAARSWCRKFGHWRGKEMRKGHQAMGLPISVESLLKYLDNASTYIVRDEWKKTAKFAQADSQVDVKLCPHSEIWIENDFWAYGHLYCDEMHQAMATGYHPDVLVVIPINIMKGDGVCKFRWMMSPNAGDAQQLVAKGDPEYLAIWESEDPAEGARKALLRSLRIFAGQYHMISTELIGRFGSIGERVLRRGVRKTSWLRAEKMRERHQQAGYRISVPTLFDHFDQCFKELWKAQIQGKDDSFTIEVEECPLQRVWANLGTGYHEIYCEETYRALLNEYLPRSEVSVESNLLRATGKCQIEIRL
jgi:hypothetical protein